MRITRRNMLQLLGLGALGGLMGWPLLQELRPRWFPPPQLTNNEQETLVAFLDVLIPADESPGALDLDVPAGVFQRAGHHDHYRRLLKRGSLELNTVAWQQNRSPFQALNPAAREKVVTQIAEDPNPMLKDFFGNIRRHAFELYYADPRSWVSLQYPGPPQPYGFPDYTQPPVPLEKQPA